MKQSSLGNLVQPFHVMELVKAADTLNNQGKPVIHLSIGEPDFPMPKPVEQALAQAISEHKTRYTAALGLPELREAISLYYQTNFQVQVPAHQIVITSGASAALMYACLALINPTDKVLLTDPGYPCNKTFVQMAGGIPDFVQTQEAHNFQPSWADLYKQWTPHTAGVLLASPNNPTGTQLGAQAMQEIVQGVSTQGGFVIVDEIYQSLCYDRPAQSVLQVTGAPSEQIPVVVINSFSKYFGMTGLRLGWMVVPDTLLPAIERFAQNLSICPNTPAQWAALACFTPETLAICEERRQVFKVRRDFVVTALPKAGIELHSTPDSAFYVYAKSPYDSERYCRELLEQALVCAVPGKDFSEFRGSEMMRFSYANSMDNLETAIERIRLFNNGQLP
ncbi:MAG: aminotransferase class I/II-fold pyridoxal phosphate-dependent enzyme [Limnobacter sp.]|uniref:aminotransferase class I/II-fold pyridoxal phosphate-dependent enzyme n=1 Tax=Limnobacter sp. TaxID=2003368 RepID=UPI0012132BB3|nr:aminotransferase class I/II-fold pyridoxal phosphate-dependent enzyme [Limnobacter sp.]MDZ4050166.1 aminotransferase class I/II-fold pyridoxal phosphate-dependent enzyme [Limnobacter sp.]RZO91740.1 MAG: aminotransferase class I/II-fold pyridoxal phosphate-dependent enzyme [Limnobacter sp.]